MPSAEVLISFVGVKKAFGPKLIYDTLELEIHRGEALTIVGRSGVGKSVMLKMLIGLLSTDAGSIHFDGHEVTKMGPEELRALRQRIAMLFQGGALFDSMNVAENVAYGLEEHFRSTMTKQDIAERVDWALELVGLPGIERMRPSSLSGGMRKRVRQRRAGGARLRKRGWASVRDRAHPQSLRRPHVHRAAELDSTLRCAAQAEPRAQRAAGQARGGGR
jgi:phospholipid/cholesterol/gamma-HCH transport system ATP-binding protein